MSNTAPRFDNLDFYTALVAIAAATPPGSPVPKPIHCRDCHRPLVGVATVANEVWFVPWAELPVEFWRTPDGKLDRDADGRPMVAALDGIQITGRARRATTVTSAACECGKSRRLHPS